MNDFSDKTNSLKDCPECGAEAKTACDTITIPTQPAIHRVECIECRLRTHSCRNTKTAIETWNERINLFHL